MYHIALCCIPLFALLAMSCSMPKNTPAQRERAPFALVGYLPEYRVDTIEAERLQAITDLVYFGLEPSADGTLPDEALPAKSLATLRAIQRVAHCRILITVGGWGRSQAFAPLAANDDARARFIAQLAALCQRYNLNGVDYDWEHPRNAEEMASYQQLLADTKAAFAPLGLLVTVAQAGWQDLGAPAYEAVDRVHLMAYDHDFPQATLAKAQADLDSLLAWGCPPQKIALGLPFYGRNAARDARTYKELVAAKTPASDIDIVDGYAFNGPETIAAKVDLARRRQLAGIMIWELGQDADYSLLRTIARHSDPTQKE
jgi:chitinase